MGMYDDVVVLDESLRCPDGHELGQFQTKSFDNPTMATYLIVGPHREIRAARDCVNLHELYSAFSPSP